MKGSLLFIFSNKDEKAPLSCLLVANNTLDIKLTEKPTTKQIKSSQKSRSLTAHGNAK